MAESDSTHGLPEYGQMMTPAENPPDMLNSDASSADKQPSLKRFPAWAIVLAAVIGLGLLQEHGKRPIRYSLSETAHRQFLQ